MALSYVGKKQEAIRSFPWILILEGSLHKLTLVSCNPAVPNPIASTERHASMTTALVQTVVLFKTNLDQ